MWNTFHFEWTLLNADTQEDTRCLLETISDDRWFSPEKSVAFYNLIICAFIFIIFLLLSEYTFNDTTLSRVSEGAVMKASGDVT